MKKITFLIAIFLGFLAFSVQAQNARINELPYDNTDGLSVCENFDSYPPSFVALLVPALSMY